MLIAVGAITQKALGAHIGSLAHIVQTVTLVAPATFAFLITQAMGIGSGFQCVPRIHLGRGVVVRDDFVLGWYMVSSSVHGTGYENLER